MATDLLLEEELLPSRYVVGIDLGTTNSAVSYVDTSEQPWRVRTFGIPQLVDTGQVDVRETLPSFHYEPAPGETSGDALRLPWTSANPSHAVGVFARDRGAQAAGRLISSAKSWLAHSGVDRTAPLLPWHAAPDVQRLSPVEVSSRYLAHLRDAWNHQFRDEPLERQDIVLTLPASFDEVARELTVQAAAKAGLPRVVLIEEPQAAFYAWIDAQGDQWAEKISPGQKILVCDIGGGTSDFTLIRVRRGEGGRVQFHRVAVGEHLILGGDNLDLALAHWVEQKLTGGKLPARQWDVLVRICRQVKEDLLDEPAPPQLTLHVPATGARLIGGGVQLEVAREEVRELLLDGFFPRVPLEARPEQRRSGFQEFGLPYAPDAAVTRYLAAFLNAHRHVALDDLPEPEDHDPARPDVVLFNGGVFASPLIRERILEVLSHWFSPASGPVWRPLLLENVRLDLAVSRGAAYYGMVRRGQGERIVAELARSYYIGVESAEPTAVCLLPGTAEVGQDIVVRDPTFYLRMGEPVEFPLFFSSTRLTDRPGQLVPVDREQMRALPPIRTALRTRRRGEQELLPVHVHARLTEIGTLDLWCSEAEGERSWRLQFDVRSATQTDVEAHQAAGEQAGYVDEQTWSTFEQLLERTFGPTGQENPEGLVKRLHSSSGLNRSDWPPSLLRRIWEQLMHLEAGRRKSAVHEARWLNLLGYALRPGYGVAVDDYRVAETWRLVQGKLVHNSPLCRTESLILWRRIAGGLSSGQQRAIAEPILASVRALHRRSTGGKSRGEAGFAAHETTEVWRLLGSLELLGTDVKMELGTLLLELLPKRKMQPVLAALCWALGRLGARVPVYGPLNTLVPVDTVQPWIEQLLNLPGEEASVGFALMQMARKTEDRYRDIDASLRSRVLGWLERHQAPGHFRQLVETGGQLDVEEQNQVFGEALPKGLRIA